MNIVVLTNSRPRKVFTRPDTSWSRKSEDLYLPDFLEGISFTPVVYARISKPGKHIAPQFASRHFDGVGYGMLLYGESPECVAEEGFAQSMCLDHTSYLSSDYLPKGALGGDGNFFSILKCGERIFSTGETNRGSISLLEEGIVFSSKWLLLRGGDLLAVELSPRTHLMDRKDGNVRIEGSYCSSLFDFQIIVE